MTNYEIVRNSNCAAQIYIGGELCVRLSHAVRDLDVLVAKSTAQKYIRKGVALFGAVDALRNHRGAQADAWSDPHLASQLWMDMLRGLGCALVRHEAIGCYFITPPDHLRDAVISGLSAAAHLYNAAWGRGLTTHNPLQIRRPSKRGEAVSLFRPKLSLGSVRTTRAVVQVPLVLAALHRCPAQVTMLFELMAAGLARLSEEAQLSVWDWAQHDFGNKIATPNKGDRSARTKFQIIPDILLGRMIGWFDDVRKDPHGLDRKAYQQAKCDGNIELMRRTPLFPNRGGDFYSYSGLHLHFRRAMKGSLASTVPHSLRIAGINDFIAWIESKPLSFDEKQYEKLKFATYLGWKSPEKMLKYYSHPFERAEIAAQVAQFSAHRARSVASIAETAEALAYKMRAAPASESCSSHMNRLLALQALQS